MRTKLKELGSEQRYRYTGKFVKYGFRYSDWGKIHAKPTMILKDIKLLDENGVEIAVADYLWLNLTVGFKKLGILIEDEIVSFNGRVATYQKGYYLHGKKVDYKLERPSKVVLTKSLIDDLQRKVWPELNWQVCNDIYDMYAEDYLKRGIAKPYPKMFN
ncbi:hypothetical protein [Companilactobacillus nantensis]|uniref:Uncharacterized protein n=1 Tax=Companilactobacillus nantensis DSM 16982 TaxID=1423774 RepID=A0A0R1WJ77_9LACO|nr:hypothetical protein [Companilactobacillus nantensis]KRM17807.1 hypothetical protein FD31_GL002327 [Companilactobacillus nantensis DSM 16982]GEO63506.1 hypothetical protein LNA01_06890 [Companilactobacillus nantensis]